MLDIADEAFWTGAPHLDIVIAFHKPAQLPLARLALAASPLIAAPFGPPDWTQPRTQRLALRIAPDSPVGLGVLPPSLDVETAPRLECFVPAGSLWSLYDGSSPLSFMAWDLRPSLTPPVLLLHRRLIELLCEIRVAAGDCGASIHMEDWCHQPPVTGVRMHPHVASALQLEGVRRGYCVDVPWSAFRS